MTQYIVPTDRYPIQTTQPTSQQPTYRLSPPLMEALQWLLANPSIPLSLRKQFFVLWENVVFGNYSERDIKFLMSKFREWCILVKWYIPEQQWGNILEYHDDDGSSVIRVDLNILLNTLEQLYFIQLTRGKGGFTLKELNTMRGIIRSEEKEEEAKKRVIRLF